MKRGFASLPGYVASWRWDQCTDQWSPPVKPVSTGYFAIFASSQIISRQTIDNNPRIFGLFTDEIGLLSIERCQT